MVHARELAQLQNNTKGNISQRLFLLLIIIIIIINDSTINNTTNNNNNNNNVEKSYYLVQSLWTGVFTL